MFFTVTDSENTMPRHLSPDVISALKGVRFIAQHIKNADKDNEVSEMIHSSILIIIHLFSFWYLDGYFDFIFEKIYTEFESKALLKS